MTSSTAASSVSGGGPSPLGQRLSGWLSAERAVGDLRRYFGIGRPNEVLPFTGSRFEHLAGGGERLEVADRITAEDLVAVQTLSVTVPASVALDILEGQLGVRLKGQVVAGRAGTARRAKTKAGPVAMWTMPRMRGSSPR
ncbi:DUF6308 family protein [Streptomyces sp. NPDC060187]|uniref:DUF6308 family protein n=1 Tax=Streptomyces sp. NPDC060187 TaxID=3347067 RepID=UPI003660A36B